MTPADIVLPVVYILISKFKLIYTVFLDRFFFFFIILEYPPTNRFFLEFNNSGFVLCAFNFLCKITRSSKGRTGNRLDIKLSQFHFQNNTLIGIIIKSISIDDILGLCY